MISIVYAIARIFPAIVIGFILYRKNILRSEFLGSLSWVVLNIASPCLIYQAIADVDVVDKTQVYLLLILGVAIYLFMGIVAFIAVKLMKVPHVSEGVYNALLVFGNSTFMGFPLAETLYGSEGLFYMAVLNIHLQIFIFTYGTFQISRCSEEGGFKPKQILNAPLIAAVIAFFVFLAGIQTPEILLKPIDFIGSMTSPVAMLILGASIGSYDLKSVFNKWRIYVVAVLRLLAVPLVMFFILEAFLGNTVMTETLTIYIGVPSASAIAMMSIVYKGDLESAAAGVGLTTILSMGTLPLLYVIMSLV